MYVLVCMLSVCVCNMCMCVVCVYVEPASVFSSISSGKHFALSGIMSYVCVLVYVISVCG